VSQLDALILARLKDLSKSTGVDLTPVETYTTAERIPTGSLDFDWMLGGGLPRGHMTTISGLQSHGKSTIATLAAATTIENGGSVALFDIEDSYDGDWGDKLGVSPERFATFKPKSGEHAFNSVLELTKAGIFDLIIYDSIAETAWEAELEGTMDDNNMAVAARKLSQFCRLYKAARLENQHTALLLINQLRSNVGPNSKYDPYIEPGGMALPFAASIQVRMLSPEYSPKDRDSGPLNQITFRAYTKKNKLAPPRRECQVPLAVGNGFFGVSLFHEIVSVGRKLGVFTNAAGDPIKNAVKWHLNGVGIATGEGEVIKALIADSVLRDAALKAINESMYSYLKQGVNNASEDAG
jgi:protein RecA